MGLTVSITKVDNGFIVETTEPKLQYDSYGDYEPIIKSSINRRFVFLTIEEVNIFLTSKLN